MFKFCKVMLFIIAIFLVLFVAVVLFMHTPKFGQLPQGQRLQRVLASPNYRNGKFQNQEPTIQFTGEKKSFGRVLLGFLTRDTKNLRPSTPMAVQKTNLHTLDPQQDNITWFGHSSYLLQIKTVRFLVDPVFVAASPVGFVNRPFLGTDVFKPEDMPDFDYLLITHDHWDHLDYKTIKRLKGHFKKVICPLGVGQHFQYWGFSNDEIIELDWNEQALLEKDFTIYCLPARHFSGRTLVSNQTLWASFLIKKDDKKVFIAGDGGYGKHFKEIGEAFNGIDFAILENGQYNQDWRYIHLMPEDMESAIRDLNPQRVMTVHHSKYALSKHTWQEPRQNALQLREKGIKILLPNIGETVKIW